VPPLYIVQQNAKIRIHNRKLSVEREAENGLKPDVLFQTPLAHVSEVILFGNIGLTTPAIDTLLELGIPVAFLTRAGEYRGQLTGSLTPHVPLRRAQYERLGQPEFCLGLAKSIVDAKLRGMRALLQRRQRDRPDVDNSGAVARLDAALEALPRKTTLDSLRGLEGSAAAAYFGAYRGFFAPEWRFTSRQRRPPPDPVNALLSFGYTLLAQISSAAVQSVGLDPYAGFLHEVVYNRPALALDIMEEFRPVVDGVVLWCCGGQLTPGDFTPGPPERPVILGEEGQRRFIQAFEQRMEQPYTHPVRGEKLPIRQCLVEQARQAAQCIRSGQVAYRGLGVH